MRRRDAFALVPWSGRQCWIALGLAALVWGASIVSGHWSLVRPLWGVHLLVTLLWFAVTAAFPLGMARRCGVLRSPGIRRMLKEFAVAIPLTLCLFLTLTLIAKALASAGVRSVESESAITPLWSAPNEPLLYLIVVGMFTLGPFAEELFFRGFLYNALRRRTVPLAAVLLQASAFALMHHGTTYGNLVQVGLVFLLGLVLAGVYEWRKTLWASILLHGLYNFLVLGPVIALLILNHHAPAKTWFEAGQPPTWLERGFLPIEKQNSGEAQRLYAINEWGSRGLHLWKQEVWAMEAVCEWFPEDRAACAQARGGIALIFCDYLRDPMRAVVHSDLVLSKYPDQPEACADALLTQARAYFMLRDLARSRNAYAEALRSYAAVEGVKEEAERGLKELDGG